ncbi:hypothetical protein [Eubacterium maltosivorans]|uniref:hypothetical protein n=1 Tax=Eubacterium maltosivorans TaxID=2041044 RepID=UPI0009421B7F|nr:hypothetical protein [Eubacterium maltosivorans]
MESSGTNVRCTFDWKRPAAAVQIAFSSEKGVKNLPLSTFLLPLVKYFAALQRMTILSMFYDSRFPKAKEN